MTSKVYFSKTGDRRNFIRKILEIFYEELKNAKKIFIKPNLVSMEPYPTTTRPETLDCILEFLIDIEKDVVVGMVQLLTLKIGRGYSSSISSLR